MDADARAREYEIISVDPAFTVKPMAEWLDLPRLAKIIQPSINQLVIKNRKAVWKAMSFGGVVYCIPDYVRDVLKLLAFEKKVLDYRLVRQSFETDNKAVLVEFSGILKQHGYLAYNIKERLFRPKVPLPIERSRHAPAGTLRRPGANRVFPGKTLGDRETKDGLSQDRSLRESNSRRQVASEAMSMSA